MSSKTIENVANVNEMVEIFYAKVRKDELIGDIFNTVIDNNWPEHIEKLTRFWQSVLLGEHTYYGSPFQPHSLMPLEAKHFNRWITLFHETIDENFIGDKAEEAKQRANNMAKMFESKIAHIKEHNPKENITIETFLKNLKNRKNEKNTN